MTTLVEEIHGNDWVVHQVLSNPRKVDQEGYIMGSEPSGWPDPRKHQDLFGDVRLKDKYAVVYPHEVNELPRHLGTKSTSPTRNWGCKTHQRMTSFLAPALSLGPPRGDAYSTPMARGWSPASSKITLVTVVEEIILRFGRFCTSGVR